MKILSRKEAIAQGLNKYFTGKPCKYGHVSERYVVCRSCVKCTSIYSASDDYKEYKKDWYQENKEQLLEYKKDWYQENKEQLLEQQKQYYQENVEQKKKYFQVNKEYINERRRNRYATDEDYKTSVICRNLIYRTLCVTSSTKNSRTYDLLGYCNEQLKESITSKFLPGMSWDNHGDWQIDHKYPVSRFIEDGITDPVTINALDNLIPMWAEHNLEKSAQTLKEFLDANEEMCNTYEHFLDEEEV